jgi:cupin 2 domain-containing protein
MKIENIFENIPNDISKEVTKKIFESKKIRIEKIISKGHSSPKGFWYDQEENEWVILLKGKAKLLFENETESVLLSEGDFVNIPSHTKHRVEWTEASAVTIWLAIFY